MARKGAARDTIEAAIATGVEMYLWVCVHKS